MNNSRSRFGARLSLNVRILINAGVVLLISGVVLLYVSTRHEAEYVRGEIEQQLESELEALRVTLADSVVIGDYTTMERAMAARLKRGHLALISWRDATGHILTVAEREALSDAPHWFIRWVGLRAQQADLPLEIGGRYYGSISGIFSPVAQINRLWWNTFLLHLAILTLAIGLDILGILFILKRGLRPLEALVEGAQRFGAGDFSTRIVQQGSPEIQRTIAAFNHMAGEVQRQNEQLGAVFDATTEFVIITLDTRGVITLFNRGAERLLGYPVAQMVGKRTLDTLFVREVHPFAEGALTDAQNLIRLISDAAKDRDWSMVRRDGSQFIASLVMTPIHDATGIQSGYLLVAQDVGERRMAERQLRIAAAAFESNEGLMVTDAQGIIQRVNGAFTKLTGYSPEEAIGQSASLLKSGRQDSAFYREMWHKLLSQHQWKGEIWNRRKNGEIFPEWLSINAVLGEDGTISHFVSSFTDISERKEAEERIQYLAFYDPLTQLPNRSLLLDRIGQAIAASGRSQRWGALLFIDLDHFKTINDSKGHEIGDLLLMEVARRIQARLREDDTVARLGGDEFVVILCNLHEERAHAATNAEQVAEDIGLALSRVYTIKGFEHYATASIGVALFHGEGLSPSEMLKHADIAMYQAKSAGRNTVRFFEPDMQAVLDARLVMEGELRQALAVNQLELYYQLQVDNSDTILGAEVLLRWRHPERGMIPPGHFIPVAEESGLIVPIGHWVLESACAKLKEWEEDPLLRRIQLAVNVSARQFRQPDFVDQVLAITEHMAIRPTLLKLELTESMVLDNMVDSIRKMEQLKHHGISFSMDDFGTGHSSLAYLKQLPLDQMKIDQSFVRDIIRDPSDAVLVKTIIAMGRSLGLDVIAEGVETEAQHRYLEEHGCGAFQGYLFSRPLPVEQFEQLVTVWSLKRQRKLEMGTL